MCDSKLSDKSFLIEPSYSADKSRKMLIARSVHRPANPLYCKILNTSNFEQVFAESNIVGQLSKAEIAEQEFFFSV